MATIPNRAAVITAILDTLNDEHGAGSDLEHVGTYDLQSGYIEVRGNLDVSQLADDVIRAVEGK